MINLGKGMDQSISIIKLIYQSKCWKLKMVYHWTLLTISFLRDKNVAAIDKKDTTLKSLCKTFFGEFSSYLVPQIDL